MKAGNSEGTRPTAGSPYNKQQARCLTTASPRQDNTSQVQLQAFRVDDECSLLQGPGELPHEWLSLLAG
eukprot:1160069-Pelagomonas_calceolata.AAC.4